MYRMKLAGAGLSDLARSTRAGYENDRLLKRQGQVPRRIVTDKLRSHGPATDKRAAIDLVCRRAPRTYEFIELKGDSDNSLFAAIEIPLYGLVFVWSKTNQNALGYDAASQPILNAKSVSLDVLAQSAFCSGHDLMHLVTNLAMSLNEFGAIYKVLVTNPQEAGIDGEIVQID